MICGGEKEDYMSVSQVKSTYIVRFFRVYMSGESILVLLSQRTVKKTQFFHDKELMLAISD